MADFPLLTVDVRYGISPPSTTPCPGGTPSAPEWSCRSQAAVLTNCQIPLKSGLDCPAAGVSANQRRVNKAAAAMAFLMGASWNSVDLIKSSSAMQRQCL